MPAQKKKAEIQTEPANGEAPPSWVMGVPIKNIVSELNVRCDFSTEGMNALIENIRVNGIIEPLVVNLVNDRYELVSGGRRLKAAEAVGLSVVPCIVHENLSLVSVHRIMIAENLLREELDPVSEAVAIQRLVDDGITQEDIGRELGKSQEFVSNRVRLLKLPSIIQEKIIWRQINPTLGLVILSDLAKMKAVSPLVDDAFIVDLCDKYILGCDYQSNVLRDLFDELAVSKFKKKVVTDPHTALKYGMETSKCYEGGCDKYFSHVCFDPACFNTLKVIFDERVLVEKAEAKKKTKEKSPEQIARENARDLFMSELREKVAMIPIERKVEFLVNRLFDVDSDLESNVRYFTAKKDVDKKSLIRYFEKVNALYASCIISGCCNFWGDFVLNPDTFSQFVKSTGISFSEEVLKQSGAAEKLEELNKADDPESADIKTETRGAAA